jgi:hypothetical protein
MIHYHGLPMATLMDMVKAMRGRHAMVSFGNPRQVEEAAEVCQSIVLDNGAYSAWRAGSRHDFDGYQAWVAHWLKHPAVEWAVIPDVIDGTERENDHLLAGWALPKSVSVPVFHLHESLERLEALTVYPRIALGDHDADLRWRRIPASEAPRASHARSGALFAPTARIG